jgi:hypothetical protein
LNSTQIAEKNNWLGTFYEKIVDDHAYISVIFSWHLQEALKRSSELKSQGIDVIMGGPAAVYAGIDAGFEVPDAVVWHNPNACRTSKGCPFHCEFCINQNIEYREYDSWIPRPIVIDDNITAGSVNHFDKVIDSLKQFDEVDFNQGISAALVTNHHAERLKELNLKYIRMAWDNINYESKFMRGWDILRRAGFTRSKIAVYILIGFHDTPEDARYRLEMVRRLGGEPFCMRYQPLDTPKRNAFVEEGSKWTHAELQRYCRYWNSLRFTSRVPFDEFENNYHGK